MKKLPTTCPSCNGHIIVKALTCDNCATEIHGRYPLPLLAALPPDDQDFILNFVKASGSLKEMAKLLRLSYPTVRNRLDEIIEHITHAQKSETHLSEDQT